jgi:hypothetical protein
MRRSAHAATTVRAECEQLLAELNLPARYELGNLRAQIEKRRGRPLRILSKPAEAVNGPCGFWISTDAEDIVFVEPATSPLHYQHILLHELGHLLFDHGAVAEPGNEMVARLLPDLDPAAVRMVLARSEYDDRQEQEAEMFATLLSAGSVWSSQFDSDDPESFWRALATS